MNVNVEATAARPMTGMEERLASARAEADERRMEQRHGSPESLPEVDRQIQILSGAVESLRARTADLIARLGPVYANDLMMAKGVERSQLDTPPIQTEVGQRLDSLYREVLDITDAVDTAIFAVRL